MEIEFYRNNEIVTGPSPRAEHTIAYNPDNLKTVLFGGSDATTLRNDTWEWMGLNGPKLQTLDRQADTPIQ